MIKKGSSFSRAMRKFEGVREPEVRTLCVGARVRIRPTSGFYDRGALNPTDEEGKVIGIFDGYELPIRVQWSKGDNVYRKTDLEVVS